MGRKRIYTEEESKERNRERSRRRVYENPDYMQEYRKTPIGRANMLKQRYNSADKQANRGKGDLTAQWIVDNIFSKPCVHCGKTGWDAIGCNRIDDSKPHTIDNVEPCCRECNIKIYWLKKKGVK